MRLKRTAQAIYQDLVDQHGFTVSYERVKRFARALRHVDPEQFDRLELAAGEEAQVDYGEGAPTREPRTLCRHANRLLLIASTLFSDDTVPVSTTAAAFVVPSIKCATNSVVSPQISRCRVSFSPRHNKLNELLYKPRSYEARACSKRNPPS